MNVLDATSPKNRWRVSTCSPGLHGAVTKTNRKRKTQQKRCFGAIFIVYISRETKNHLLFSVWVKTLGIYDLFLRERSQVQGYRGFAGRKSPVVLQAPLLFSRLARVIYTPSVSVIIGELFTGLPRVPGCVAGVGSSFFGSPKMTYLLRTTYIVVGVV